MRFELGQQGTKVPKNVYLVSFMGSLSGGFYWPYIPIYAVEMGASYSQIGLVASISNAAPNVFQPLWGYLSDRMFKRVLFISLGYIVGGTIILFFTKARDPITYILLLALSMIFYSAVPPAWNSYIGSFFKQRERGRGIGKIAGIGWIGNIIGASVSGMAMTLLIGEQNINQYVLAFSLAGLISITTGLIALSLRESSADNDRRKSFSLRVSITENKLFWKLCLIEAFWGMSLSFAWPMFSAAYIVKLHATKLEIAVASVIFSITFALSQTYLGYLVDRYGRRKILLITKYVFPIYPLIWFIAWDVKFVYVANFIVGISNALAVVSVLSYILDITVEEERGSYFAVYNMVMGFSWFLGSLLGGFIGDLLSKIIDPIGALQMVFLISIFIRILTAIPYYFIQETLERQ